MDAFNAEEGKNDSKKAEKAAVNKGKKPESVKKSATTASGGTGPAPPERTGFDRGLPAEKILG